MAKNIIYFSKKMILEAEPTNYKEVLGGNCKTSFRVECWKEK